MGNIKQKQKLVTLLAILSFSPAALGLGLGDITIHSKLNQPLDADIEITSGTREELADLLVSIPSDDAFERYDLERLGVFSSIRFTIEERPDNRKVIHATSSAAVKDPFLTFLIQADWAQGRMLREYTVFVDPPLFVPSQPDTSQPYIAPAATNTRASGNTRGAVARVETGDDYRVRRGDTLSQIARRLNVDNSYTDNQIMLALFRENESAFVGNINRLKAGHILRVPSSSEFNRISRQSANSEVRTQMRNWRASVGAKTGATASAGSNDENRSSTDGTLVLTVPDLDSGFGGDAGSAGTGIDAAGEERIQELQTKVQDFERLLAAKDNELAALQEQLAEQNQLATDVSLDPLDPAINEEDTTVADTTEIDTTVDPAIDSEVTDPLEDTELTTGAVDVNETGAVDVNETGAVDESDASLSGEDATTTSDVEADNTVDEPVTTDPVTEPVTTPAVSTPSITTPEASGLMKYVKPAGFGLLAILLGLLGLFGYKKFANKKPSHDSLFVDEDLDLAAENIAEKVKSEITKQYEDGGVTSEVATIDIDEAKVEPALGLDAPVDFDLGSDVEAASVDEEPITESIESGEALPFDDTTLADVSRGTMQLDQNDPIAETDFHMAYGLYDQAAELMQGAIASDNKFSYKEKLLEVYFVSGNKSEFLRFAKEIKDEAISKHSSAWDNIVIMGKQLTPDEDLFSGDVSVAGLDESLDFSIGETGNLEVDQSLFDGLPEASDETETGLDALDLHLEATQVSNEMPDGLQLHGDSAESTEEIKVGDVLDMDLGLTSTSEVSDLDFSGAEDFADMDLDLSDLGLTEANEFVADESDETQDFAFDLDKSDDIEVSGDSTELVNALNIEATNSTKELKIDENFDLLLGEDSDQSAIAELDLDLAAMIGDGTTDGFSDDTMRNILPKGVSDDDSGTMSLGATPGKADTDLMIDDVLNPDDSHSSTSRITDDELAAMGLSDSGPEDIMGMSGMAFDSGSETDEVSTKLDLARAYIEMDDPDNAKSILQEVVEDGNDAQRSEAQDILSKLT